MKNMTKADFNTFQLLGKNSKIYCTNGGGYPLGTPNLENQVAFP